MNTPIIDRPARRRSKKVEPEFGFSIPDIGRYRLHALNSIKAEALRLAKKESSNDTQDDGEAPLLDQQELQGIYEQLVDMLLRVRDTAQNRTRQLRLMEEVSKGGER